MSEQRLEIEVRRKRGRASIAIIKDKTIVISGGWLKTAAVMDEHFLEGETVPEPESFVARIRESKVRADIFTFAQKFPDVIPKYKYQMEWDNFAAIPITTYTEWWERRAKPDVRTAVKRSRKMGVVVKLAEFDDSFVEGICRIYNESAIRQGVRFEHYHKDFETVKRENSTYLERSAYIGAYYNDELIGFIRMVYIGAVASTLQVIGQRKYFDKKPMNALISKAVEICESKGLSHLVYGSFVYNDRNSSLTEFKRRNGFEEVLLPRYYIPLTPKGKMALQFGLHRRLSDRLPQGVLTSLKKVRNVLHKAKLWRESMGG